MPLEMTMEIDGLIAVSSECRTIGGMDQAFGPSTHCKKDPMSRLAPFDPQSGRKFDCVEVNEEVLG